MKKSIIIFALFTLFCFSGCARDTGGVSEKAEGSDTGSFREGNAGVILSHRAARNFITGEIPEDDLNLIVQSGIRAPSARNLQPWFFTVVRNMDIAQKIIPQTVDGNVLIVVSAEGDGKTNYVQILDCSLAVQNIYLAAQALGYGSRIYTAPIENLNNNLKNDLEIPQGRSAVAVVRIGLFDSEADAISGASSRREEDTMVTYK